MVRWNTHIIIFGLCDICLMGISYDKKPLNQLNVYYLGKSDSLVVNCITLHSLKYDSKNLIFYT